MGVVHGDLRLGNFIVGDDGLRAMIDWEFWHLGDPVEDLAWLCARPWRFGHDDKPAAGLGSVEELLDGYGAEVDPARLRWWDVVSQAKWGAYCARQAALRREGAHASLERTVLARRVAEAEWDMLELIARMSGDRPDARELVEAVASWLANDLAPGLEAGPRFQAIVAAQGLAIASRELDLADEHARSTARRSRRSCLTPRPRDLRRTLSDAIAAGVRRRPQTIAPVLREHVRRKLAIARPGYDAAHSSP